MTHLQQEISVYSDRCCCEQKAAIYQEPVSDDISLPLTYHTDSFFLSALLTFLFRFHLPPYVPLQR